MRILVLGASGYIGSNLIPRLAAAGHTVRAAARRVEVLTARGWDGVDCVAADAFDEASLDAALRDIDVAYYLVHSMGGGGGFVERDKEAAANFRDAAARAGVKRIVYLGGIRPAGEASPHLASRLETGDVLRAGPVPVTELRAGLIVGAGSVGFEVIRDLVNHLPVMITPRWVRSRTQAIALDDLLAYLEGVLDHPETEGRTFDVCGPETLIYRDLLSGYAKVADRPFRALNVPFLTPRLSSYWLGLVTSVPISVARPLVEGLKTDLVGDDTAIRAILPIPLHTYEQAIRAGLDAERSEPIPARWAEGAFAFRGYNADVSFYSKGETSEQPADAPAEMVWDTVRRIGGKRGYYYADWLWVVRGGFDRLIGGVGLRRGRRHPTDVRLGDTIDFWRVVGIEPGHRLTLMAEMKLPGTAVLEFTVEPRGESRSVLRMDARFHPSGVWGLLYWYSLVPAHNFIFRRMPRNMIRAAEREARKAKRVAEAVAPQ